MPGRRSAELLVRAALRSARWAAVLSTWLAAMAPCGIAAQVVELQGGGSSLYESYGLSANLWGGAYDGWLGVAFQDTWRVGGRLRSGRLRDTVSAGNDVLLLRHPTDLFGAGTNVLVQGVSWSRTAGPVRARVFAGASATGLGAPGFQPLRPEDALGGVFFERPLTGRLQLSGLGVFSRRQSMRTALAWDDHRGTRAAMTGGTGANRGYGAASLVVDRGWWRMKSMYVEAARGYRPTDTPTPAQSRPDGFNAELDLRPLESLQLVVGRQGFATDPFDGAATAARAVGTSAMLRVVHGAGHFALGGYHSDFGDSETQSAYASLGRSFGAWFGADVYVLHTEADGLPTRTVPVLTLHERLGRRLTLSQMAIRNTRDVSVALGATFLGDRSDLGVGYQIVHAPFNRTAPFQRTLNLHLRLQLGDLRTSIATTVTPSGAVFYDASAAGFLYLGGENGLAATTVTVPINRFVLRGQVIDTAGQPVSGAALRIGGLETFTDTQGRFEVRFRNARPVKFEVLLEEFLEAGRYAVVEQPQRVSPVPETKRGEVRVVLRRQQ